MTVPDSGSFFLFHLSSFILHPFFIILADRAQAAGIALEFLKKIRRIGQQADLCCQIRAVPVLEDQGVVPRHPSRSGLNWAFALRYYPVMILRRDINRFVQTLAREFSPERVVLFGSYARGEASEDSDVDLLVIMRHGGDSVDQALAIRQRLDCEFPLDLIVKTPEETRRRVRSHDMFLTSVLAEGRTLYERQRQRVDRKSRG